MPDASSVGFHPDLEISLLSPLRDWSDAEVRAIDMSGYNRNSSAGLPLLWDGKCQQGALISNRSKVWQPSISVGAAYSPCEEILSAFLDILLPFVYFTDLIAEREEKTEMSLGVTRVRWWLI
jgi:hypothetical protein